MTKQKNNNESLNRTLEEFPFYDGALARALRVLSGGSRGELALMAANAGVSLRSMQRYASGERFPSGDLYGWVTAMIKSHAGYQVEVSGAVKCLRGTDWSWARMARLIDITPASMHQWANGVDPSLRLVRRLAKGLEEAGVFLDYGRAL